MNDLLRHLKAAIFPALCVCGIFYYAHYALHGGYGYGALVSYRQDIADTKAELSELQETAERLEHRTALLRTRSVDPDMLDERARALLGYAHPDDLIVPLDPAP